MSEEKLATPELRPGFGHMFCGRHGEPYRAAFPKGYVVAVALLMAEMLQDDGVMYEARKITGEVRPDPLSVLKVLDVKPACCRVSNSKMVEIYNGSGIKEFDACDVCGKRAYGSKYKTQTKDYPHVCFVCVVSAETTLPH